MAAPCAQAVASAVLQAGRVLCIAVWSAQDALSIRHRGFCSHQVPERGAVHIQQTIRGVTWRPFLTPCKLSGPGKTAGQFSLSSHAQ
eukprot:354852-Chlamydomonas_euryale.AAC.2